MNSMKRYTNARRAESPFTAAIRLLDTCQYIQMNGRLNVRYATKRKRNLFGRVHCFVDRKCFGLVFSIGSKPKISVTYIASGNEKINVIFVYENFARKWSSVHTRSRHVHGPMLIQ